MIKIIIIIIIIIIIEGYTFSKIQADLPRGPLLLTIYTTSTTTTKKMYIYTQHIGITVYLLSCLVSFKQDKSDTSLDFSSPEP